MKKLTHYFFATTENKDVTMCYELSFSTDSPNDLSTYNSSAAFFESITDNGNEDNVKYKYKYRLATGDPECCSCFFRTFEYEIAKDLSFSQLQKWYEEEPDDMNVSNTKWILQIIKDLVNEDYQVDTHIAQGYMSYDPPEEEKVIHINNYNNDNFAFIECIYYDYKK
ncbi:hypothetical protein [Psychrobacter fjordensis]|uniref:hypothetical protein n=1 Tax=Psychrobacter fjordensis TaxID=664424 RepID=UPI0019194089|nr:hypothetical protein [Psychrobacter fjordensis]